MASDGKINQQGLRIASDWWETHSPCAMPVFARRNQRIARGVSDGSSSIIGSVRADCLNFRTSTRM
jgi:hypothetical protein